MSAAAEKAALRSRFRELLATVPDDERAAAGRRVAERVLALPEVAAGGRVVTCLSFGDELDTWELVERLRGRGARVAAPRAVPGTTAMTVHPLPCRLETLAMGLRQPAAGEPEAGELAGRDVVLVLGLAFDEDGYRLGHGKGYFDRFLAGTAAVPVGLALERQVVPRLPRAPHDVPMRLVVTEERVRRPGAPFA